MVERLICIDFGTSYIGIAVGQTVTKTATPLAIIPANNGIPQWDKLDKIIIQWNPKKIIIGLPLDMHDKVTKTTEEAKVFSSKIQARYLKPVYMVNELLSTREVIWKFEDMKKKRSKKSRMDSFAACIILETWMNTISN